MNQKIYQARNFYFLYLCFLLTETISTPKQNDRTLEIKFNRVILYIKIGKKKQIGILMELNGK